MMTSEEATEELRSFRPMNRPWFPDNTTAELGLLEEECDQFITLAGGCAAALPAEANAEMRRRAETLKLETAAGTEYDRSRLKAITEFIRPLHGNDLNPGFEERWGRFNAVEDATLYPVEYASKLTLVQGKLGVLIGPDEMSTNPEAVDAGLDWEDVLTGLNEKLEARKYWGSALLVRSLAVTNSVGGSYRVRHRLRRALVPQFASAYRAVVDAAVDLVRWSRAEDTKPAIETPRDATTASGWLTHSDDFTSVRWGEASFVFSRPQAKCVAMLWEAFQRGIPDVPKTHLIQKCGSEGKSVSGVFRVRKDGLNRSHPAWKTMIVLSERKGAYRIAPPPTVDQHD